MEIRVSASAPLRRAPFPVARQPLSVREWNVSSEPALLQHPQVAGEAAESAAVRFDEVFRRHAPYVGALILKLIGRPGDVDDLVQDVFIQAHRGLSKLREPDAVRPWLRRITVRRTQRWLRKRRVLRWFGESDIDTHQELADPSASPEDRATLTYVYRTLETMPRDERLAWVLRFVEGETLESIAELLGSSVSTIQRRLRAAEARMGEIR